MIGALQKKTWWTALLFKDIQSMFRYSSRTRLGRRYRLLVSRYGSKSGGFRHGERHTIMTTTSARINSTQSTALDLRPGRMDKPTGYPYAYTGGRWLNKDKLQRSSRYITFDFMALCNRLVELRPECRSVKGYEKRDGGFNRVFVFSMEDGSMMVAKLPTRVAGPRRLTTNSEVATIQYLATHSSIPVPKILDWSDDATNPIKSEYIIMDYVQVVRLHEKWSEMTTQQHVTCVKTLALLVRDMATIRLPGYGSLYFADIPLESSQKIDAGEGFCIGPNCSPVYWDCIVGESRNYTRRKPNRGAWQDLASYCSGLVDTGFSRLPKMPPGYQRSMEYVPEQECFELLTTCEQIIRALEAHPDIRATATPTLIHPDFNMRNIFVSEEDPTIITAVIDWQSTVIDPAFMYAVDTPDFAEDPHDAKILEADGTHPIEISETERKKLKDQELCSQVFEVCMKGFVPNIALARSLDRNLSRLFRLCLSSWRTGAVVMREELIELSKRWNDLGLEGTSPYLPTAEDLNRHQKQYEEYESAQKLKLWLMAALNTDSDGWVPTNKWEETKNAHQEAFDLWLESAEKSQEPGSKNVMSKEKASRLWPFSFRN